MVASGAGCALMGGMDGVRLAQAISAYSQCHWTVRNGTVRELRQGRAVSSGSLGSLRPRLLPRGHANHRRDQYRPALYGPRHLAGTDIRVATLKSIDSVTPVVHTTRCDPTSGRVGSIVVLPSGDRGAPITLGVVAAIGDAPMTECLDKLTGGCIVARRSLSYVEYHSLAGC